MKRQPYYIEVGGKRQSTTREIAEWAVDLTTALAAKTAELGAIRDRADDSDKRARAEFAKREAAQKNNREAVKQGRLERERRKKAEAWNAELEGVLKEVESQVDHALKFADADGITTAGVVRIQDIGTVIKQAIAKEG